MSKKFAIDLSKFKKVKVDGKSTTLRHPEGHEITIAHSAIGPEMTSKLKALPHYADGGVSGTQEDKKVVDPESPQYKLAHSKAFVNKDSTPLPSNATADNGYAKGGRVMMADGGEPCTNPSCPSCGSPHPNCQCYARGGQVAHYADGSEETVSPDDATPQAGSFPEALGSDLRALGGYAADKANGVGQSIADTAKNFQAGLSGKSPEELQGEAAVTANVPPTPPLSGPQPSAVAPQPSSEGQQSPKTGPIATDDPYGYQTLVDNVTKGAKDVKAGNNAFAIAVRDEGENQAREYQHAQEEGAQVLQAQQDHLQKISDEHDAFMKEVQDKQIDPTHYIGSMSTMGKVGTAIGLMISGMGAGMTGQENMASKYLNAQIDRDIDAQKADLGKRETLLSANMKHYGNIMDAANMTRVSMNNLLSMKINQAAAQAKGPQAQAMAQKANGELQMQNAQLMSQTAARQTLTSQINSGNVNPYRVIDMMAPEAERPKLREELEKAQGMVKAKDNVLHAFDTVAKLQTVGNRVMNPMQSESQIAALMQPVVAELSKATAGKFTDSDAKMLGTLFPKVSDNAQTRALKFKQINAMVSKEMNFENLKKLGINPEAAGRYGQQGQSTSQIEHLRKK